MGLFGFGSLGFFYIPIHFVIVIENFPIAQRRRFRWDSMQISENDSSNRVVKQEKGREHEATKTLEENKPSDGTALL